MTLIKIISRFVSVLSELMIYWSSKPADSRIQPKAFYRGFESYLKEI